MYTELGGSESPASARTGHREHCYNPFVGAVVRRARILSANTLAYTDISERRRDELESLVSATIDSIAACYAAGLSPQERDDAVADILDERVTSKDTAISERRVGGW